MKNLLFIFRTFLLVSLITIILSCRTDESNNVVNSKGDSILVNKIVLQQYRVNPCLVNLLQAIVSSNKKNYPSYDFFYSLSLQRTAKFKLLTVNVYLWRNLRKFNFVGTVNIKGASFLCQGDIKNDELFKIDGSRKMTITTRLKKEEPAIFPSIEEPILSGTFSACVGIPIHLEIYTKEKIKGY